MAKEVVVTAGRIKRWHNFGKLVRIGLLFLLVLLLVLFLVLRVVFHQSSFVVSLKDNNELKSGLAIYESLYDRTGKRMLKVENLQFMDNISVKWLPDDINEGEGSHNGENYIAYSFYIENQGEEVFDYWYDLYVDDVIKNVDEAVRIMIILNDEKTIYAKGNSINGEAEKGTTKFKDLDDGTIILEERQGLNPGDIDKMTIVVWIEGDDPECIDALIGGEIKMHMIITDDHIENEEMEG